MEDRGVRGVFLALSGLLGLYLGASASAQVSVRSVQDPVGDAVVRRSDAEANGPIDPGAHRLPDLVSYAIGTWQPIDPSNHLFAGAFTFTGEFFRLDLVFDGLVNPPGTSGCCGYPFDPFQYGDHPVFGYVEIDMDASMDTGGELEVPELMYLGNAARFGGLPGERRLARRAARGYTAFDGNIATPPFVDRSGEEFHVAFQGWRVTATWRSDSTDSIFGVGETWVVTGRLLSRAHGYERFSYACDPRNLGSYEPLVNLQFAHDVGADQTTVSLVYPLTNAASAAMVNAGAAEDPNCDPRDQNSVLEALDELVFSVHFATPIWLGDPDFAIIENWGLFDLWSGPNDVTQFLNPPAWRINIIVGTSYAAEVNDAHFVWTDLMPDVVFGDFSGDGIISWLDLALFDKFLITSDGQAGVDEDGVINGVVDLVDFGPNFSLFDVNYDGLVDTSDRPQLPVNAPAPGDFDRDGDVDQRDFGFLQVCMTGTDMGPRADRCVEADFDLDDDVDRDDYAAFELCATAPAVRARVTCWPPPSPTVGDGGPNRKDSK